MGIGLAALGHSVVRVLDPNGEYVGLGYRVDSAFVITCAHVVAEALGTNRHAPDPPTGEVLLDVPFAPAGESKVRVPATIVLMGWLPVSESAGPTDLALLQVVGTTALPLPGPLADISPAISRTGTFFDAYGGPKGHERDLISLEGRVRAPIANGRWQISARDSDYDIAPGCSGGPAIDAQTGQVIGLIAQDEQESEIRAGFLIPAKHLLSLLDVAKVPRTRVPGLEPLRQWLNAHLHGMVAALADPIRRFIDYYAGAPDRPMPFAGRDEVFAILDQHMADGGGAFVLVSGAAGLGKSALLLHWMARQIRQNPRLHLLFLPVSIRFDTAAAISGLRLLHAQLESLFAELAFPKGLELDQAKYREQVGAAWGLIAQVPDERFLLVIDGADEVSGPWLTGGVLPNAIPANLTLVLAARHKPGDTDGRAWLTDFPVAPECHIADPLELQRLPREAVGEAIAQLGHPLDTLPERDGMLDALYRLTDRGDPLLVGLWTGEIWKVRDQAASLKAADLGGRQPGYGGFVSVWIEDQIKVWEAVGIDAHPDDLRRLLRVLALARGPLALRDWLDLAERLATRVPWGQDTARKVLGSAYCLIVGDAERGYAFVHPRLADYFHHELQDLKSERLAIPRAYLDWGAKVVTALNCGDLPVEQCPVYLLRHYTAHVLAGGLTTDEALDQHLLALLGEGWLRAWNVEEGGYDGYLMDLQRVQEAVRGCNAERSRPPYRIGAEIRCAFICASLFSSTEHLPPRLIVALAEAGLWTPERALWAARRVPGWDGSINALVGLAGLSRGDTRQQILQEALAATRSQTDKADVAITLVGMVGQFTGDEWERVVREGIEAARLVDNDEDRADLLALLAREVTGDLDLQGEIVAAARNVKNRESRASALAAAAAQLTGDECRKVLYEAIEEMSHAYVETDSFWGLVAPLAGLIDGNDGKKDLGQALVVAQGMHDDWFHYLAEASAQAAEQLIGKARTEALGEALAAVLAIRDELRKAWTLASVVKRMAGEPALLSDALAAARNISNWHPSDRAGALAALAPHLTGDERRDVLTEALAAASDALALMNTINYEGYRVEALALLVRELTEEPDLLGKSLALVRGIADEGSRIEALSLLVGSLGGQPVLLNEALAMARAFGDLEHRSVALTLLAGKLPGEQRREILSEAVAASLTIGDDEPRAAVLAALAGQLAAEVGFLRDALVTARGIEHDMYRGMALEAVAGHLAKEPKLLDEIQAAARGIAAKGSRVRVLAAIAGQLAGEQRREILVEALVTAATIDDRWQRLSALKLVAFALHWLSWKERWRLRAKTLAAARDIRRDWTLADGLGRAAAQAARRTSKLEKNSTVSAAETANSKPAPSFAEFAEWLDSVSELPRDRFLGLVKAYLPTIVALGGGVEVRATAEAIRDTGRWWP